MVIEEIIDEDKLSLLNKIPKNFDYPKNQTIVNEHKTYYIDTLSIFDFNEKLQSRFLFIKDISEFKDNLKGINIIVLILLFLIMFMLFFFGKKYIGYFEKTLNQFFTNIIENEKNKKNYLKAIENSSSNFSITTDGEKLISINKATLDFFNYESIEEFKEEHDCVCDFFIDKSGYVQKEMGELRWIEYLIENQTIPNKVILEKDNEKHIFLIKAVTFMHKDEKRYLTTFVNITELEELQNEFKYIIKRNQFAEKGANIALWDWNLSNDNVFYSAIWKSILGYSEDEIDSELSQWHQRIHSEDVDKVISDLDEHFDGKSEYFISQHRLLHKNGKYIHTIFRGQAIFENNLPIRMVGIYTDITKEQNAIQKIKEQEELMLAQSRHAAMGEMISMIAHQWRQPIASIAMGVNNMLLDIELESVDNDDLTIECNEILEQTKYLSNTIDDFRNFFKADKEKVVVSIESVIEDALKLMNKSLESDNIEVETEYFHTDTIETLPKEILQILINLIKNAKEVLVENQADEIMEVELKMKISIRFFKHILQLKMNTMEQVLDYI